MAVESVVNYRGFMRALAAVPEATVGTTSPRRGEVERSEGEGT
jgi:hypothetical protein